MSLTFLPDLLLNKGKESERRSEKGVSEEEEVVNQSSSYRMVLS